MKQKRTSRWASRRRRLRFESLENRCLLTAGFGAAVEDGHVHTFPGTIPPGAVEGAGGSFDVRHNVGAAKTAILGADFSAPPSSQPPGAIAVSFLKNNAPLFDAKPGDFDGAVVASHHTSNISGLTHVYLQQAYQGIDVFGGLAGVSINPAGQVFYASSNFASNVAGTLNTTTPSRTPEQAIAAAAQNLGVTAAGLTAMSRNQGPDREGRFTSGGVSHDPIPIKLEILPMSATQSRLVWNLVINLNTTIDWYEMNVDAVTGQVLGRYNYTAYDSYRVFPLPLESPQDGPGLPLSHQVVVNPAHPVSSPFGWHDTDGVPGPEFTETRGNNVDAREDRDADFAGNRVAGGPGNNYNFPFDPTQTPLANINQATVNLFYWNNIVHDVMALNGFDEAAGNFQFTNYSGQGLGGDAVDAFAQHGADVGFFNNAAFATPPEGIPPFMVMFEFTLTNPFRDSDNDAGVIVHEYFHGVSNRLVGGPANVTGLAGIQSGGMGEGWSDFFGLVFTAKPTDASADSYPIGTYVLGDPPNGPGIRRFPYSTNKAVNPLTYNDIDINQSEVCNFFCDEVHNVGEIWASALWDMYWLIVNRDGFDPNLYTGSGGNNLVMRLVTEAMKLTPSNPTMLQARDAILAADVAMTGGANSNEIWTAFAGRGMGFSATDGGDHNSTMVMEAFDLPPAQIIGAKFSDLNRNGIRDPGEPGLEGWTIYVDLNRNGVRDANEISAVTDASGGYVLNVLPLFEQFGPRAYDIREELQLGWEQTFPRPGLPSDASPASLVVVRDGFYTVTIDEVDTIVGGVSFGNFGAPGQIRGFKFFDENGNGVRDSGEAGQPGVTIQLFDELGNLLETTVTGADGSYAFIDLPPDQYVLDEVVPFNQTKTLPTPQNGGVHLIDLKPTQVRINVNFGNFGQRGALSGRKFNDTNGNGVHDSTELGIQGTLIYVDLNRNGDFNLGEPAATTDVFGRYRIPKLVPGDYFVRELIPGGVTQTSPGGDGAHIVTIIAGEETMNVHFFNRTFRDFGDAPAPYPTLAADGGASHGTRPGFFLGRKVDAENDGQPNATATGDDTPGASFEPPVDITVAADVNPVNPVSAAAANLDGQLGPDLVVVNPVSSSNPTRGSITVLLNLGGGVFSDPVEYLVGVQPRRVAFGDFDGRNGLDIAVSNSGDDSVSILLNRGNGTFEPAVSVAAGPGPRGIAAGDLNGDGRVDIAVSNTGVGVETVSILLNAMLPGDDLEFDDPLEIDVNEGPVADVTLGDIDRDGDLDLVTANDTQNTVSVLRNTGVVAGDLTFAAPQNYFVGSGPVHVIVADLNRDNRPDLATANRISGTVSVLLNRGNGTFFPNQDTFIGGQPTSVAAADMDNDGDRDLVVANGDAGLVYVLVNDSNGNFTLGDPLAASANPVFVVAADFNEDGGPDVITVNQAAGNISHIATSGDDEDGVRFSPVPLRPGRTAVIDVTASAAGLLNAWIDFNLDGDWNDPGEQIFDDEPLVAGLNRLVILVPATATVGNTFARFRFSEEPGLGPTGPAKTGEVEDHRVGIGVSNGAPSSFQNPQNALDVNADGMVTLFDALVLINDLQANGVRALPDPPAPGQGPPPFLDPSGDGFVTLNDVLLVINGVLVQMALQAPPEPEGAGLAAEGEAETFAGPAAIVLPPAGAGAFSLPPREPEQPTISAAPSAADAGASSAASHFVHDEDDREGGFNLSEEDDELDATLEAIAGDVGLAWGADVSF